VHRWEVGLTAAAEAAIASARAGVPTVLLVEGAAGTGKTTFLDDVREEALGFHELYAEGLQGSARPFSVLQQWGALPVDLRVQQQVSPFVVAQWLRARIDQMPTSNPLLLRLDDLHWADPESVEALTWLLKRAMGDRLLVTVGARVLPTGEHVAWQRWVRSAGSVSRVVLTGLPQDAAVELVQRRWPAVSHAVAVALWTHTAGNPLYLTALLKEYRAGELAQARVLPAPAEYAQLTAATMGRLDPDGVALVEAAAVLGSGWSPLSLLAELAGVPDASAAAQPAVDAGLLQVQSVDGALSARTHHALTGAAVYQHIPLTRRRSLHRRAAAAIPDTTSVFENRMAAADSWDEKLADELARAADELHRARSHRLAAQYLRWSSTLTADPRLRLQRTLDALFDQALSPDRSRVPAGLDDVDGGGEPIRTALARGTYAALSGRWDEAVRVLGPAARRLTAADDPLLRHRVEVLLGWAQLIAGAPADTVLSTVARAARPGALDPAIEFFTFYSAGIAAARATTVEALADGLIGLPDNPGDSAPGQSLLLQWRGDLRTFRGFLSEGREDRIESNKRTYSGGLVDISHGGNHGILGVSQWFTGQWARAQIAFRLATEVSGGALMPIARTYTPLYACGVGDFAQADRLIAEAEQVLVEMPWQEAVQSLLILRVVRAHAGGQLDERHDVLGDLRRRWPHALVDTGLVSSLWLMHAIMAAGWAGDLDQANRWILQMLQPAEVAPWVPAAAAWQRGQIARQQGDAESALSHLREAADGRTADIPLYRAHILGDLADAARAVGGTVEADSAAASAAALYRKLGATPYLERLVVPAQRPGDAGPRPPGPAVHGWSDREQEVVALVSAGMSYAQIGRELFITRSTVGFHLSNIYAKAGVQTRHGLVALTRAGASG